MPKVTRSFSLANALVLAQASRNAYAAPDAVRAAYQNDATVVDLRFYSVADTQAFLLATRQCVVVAFRGSEPDQLADWLTDAEVYQVPGPLGLVHRGFLAALMDVWTDLMTRVRSPELRDLPLYFTGHSLGGALAVLSTAKMLQMSLPVAAVYTFGQPRVGDAVFCRNYEADFVGHTFRFVNDLDIVPRVPPRILNYNHVGEFKFFDAKGRFRTGLGFWQKLLDDVQSFTMSAEQRFQELKLSKPEGIADHAIARYIARIEENLARQK
jgi:triacylglycerol lipase